MGVRIPPPVPIKHKKMSVISYVSEAFEELKTNVTWPDWPEVQRYTIVVALFSVLFALATWGVDELFAKSLAGFFNWIKA
ncbi:MAG: preprotein translocase subunit SecE [Flavobacterium sp.]|nr:MAG: preprotein translocase subunit SecE [Flavobacterium sp.]